MTLRHLVREIVYSPTERVPSGAMRREVVLVKRKGQLYPARTAYINDKGEFIIEVE
jgi:hypothetical protein